jgi:hypothetical protein
LFWSLAVAKGCCWKWKCILSWVFPQFFFILLCYIWRSRFTYFLYYMFKQWISFGCFTILK